MLDGAGFAGGAVVMRGPAARALALSALTFAKAAKPAARCLAAS